MGSSLKLFTVRGIDIRLHFTFPLILLWAAFQFGTGFGRRDGRGDFWRNGRFPPLRPHHPA